MSFAIDMPEVLKMEKQLHVDVIERVKKYNGTAGNDEKALYTQTSLEEHSRNYHTVSVAASAPPLESIEYQATNAAHLRFPDVDELDDTEDHPQLFKGGLHDQSRFIHNYHPESSPQTSTFRRIPLGNKSLVDNCAYGYTKLLVSIGPKEKIRYTKQILEPIFGSASLYAMSKRGDGDLTKLCETFRFEVSPPNKRRYFKHVFDPHLNADCEDKNHSVHINPVFSTSKCLFSFPTEYLNQDIFLVIELSKVLTGDPDKALLPYTNPDKRGIFGGGAEPDNDALQEACKRLHKFQQPLGISVVKVFNPNGQVYQNVVTPGASVVPHFALKTCMNDTSLKQHIQDMLPPEGSSPQIRLDVTGIEICLSMHNLGEVTDLNSIYPPDGLFTKSDSVMQSDVLQFLPSQFHTEEEAEDTSWVGRSGEKLAVRHMMTLHPSNGTVSEEAIRGMRFSLDHTIFIYPKAFENFHKSSGRNLCMEIQLIEFVGVEADNPMSREYEVLNSIYNPIPGPMFCPSATTRVSYHKTSPEMNDEIKIRLPLALNRNHHLLFRVYHVHVKSDRRASMVGGIFGGKKSDESGGEVCQLIGQSYLPLMTQWGCLLTDSEYALPVLDDSDETGTPNLGHLSLGSTDTGMMSEISSASSGRPSSSGAHRRSSSGAVKYIIPTVIVRTKAYSSFISSNKDLQYFLSSHPPPLGHLPSLTEHLKHHLPPIIPMKISPHLEAASFVSMSSSVNPGQVNSVESLLLDSTMYFVHLSLRLSTAKKSDSLGGSNDGMAKVELSRHFFGIMRQLVRVMCGGDSCCRPKYANPYAHSDLRCSSFLALLRIFDVVAPNVQSGIPVGDSVESEPIDAEYLRAYVEFVFDEEVYTKSSRTEGRGGSANSPNKTAKALLKTRRSLDLVRQQHSTVVSENDILDMAVDHALAQVEEIVYQGSLLSSIGKISHEVMAGKLESDDKDGARWWRGYINEKSILEEIEIQLATGIHPSKMTSSGPDAVNPLKEPLVVQPILPRYDSLEGYISRRHRLKELLRDTDLTTEPPPMQWWPWMYEVIVHQWCAFLSVFDPRKRERLHAANAVIEEEEEEEDENTEDDQWQHTSPYPFKLDDPIFRESKVVESLRSLATKHGPILLAMIMKSLSLRIVRDHKNAPVVMDEEFIVALEALMSALAREVHTRGKSVLPCRRLNMAISIFLRDLFGLIVPLQAARIVHAYFFSSRKIQRENQEISQKPQIDHVKTRINFIHELVRMDHFFAVNFPLHIGQPFSSYVFNPVFTVKEFLQRSSGTIVRGINNPPHHWLVHLVLHEIMTEYISLEKNLREGSMRMLRELLVRLSYDARLQSGESRHRTCSMFLPIINFIVDIVEHFDGLPVDCVERKEALAMVVHVLQDTPEFLQRELWRRMTYSRVGGQVRTPVIGGGDSPRGPPSSSFLNSDKGPQGNKSRLPIHNAVSLFNLIIDTFELPLSDAGAKGDVSCVLSPGVAVEEPEGTQTSDTTSEPEKPQKGRNVAVSTRNRVGTADALSQLEARHNMKAKGAAGRKTGGRGEERSWKKSIKQTTIKNPTSAISVSLTRSLTAAKHVNHTSTMCVLKVVSAMLEECPGMLQPMTSKYSDSTFNEGMERFMSTVLTLLLHCMSTKQSEIAVCNTFRCAENILKQYGATGFMHFVGDTFQFWLRATLISCSSLFAALRLAATRFLFSLMLSSYQWTGSLSAVSTPLTAVLRDVIETLHLKFRGKSSLLANNKYLEPLRFSIGVMKENALSRKCKQLKASSSLLLFLNNLDNLITVYAFIMSRLPYTVLYDWSGANTLDSISYKDSTKGQGIKNPDLFRGEDIDSVIASFIEAADSIDSLQLPRIKMYILANLSKIHDIIGNPAESAMVRWKIYEICVKAKPKCTSLWAPKPPLKWSNSKSSSDSNSQMHFCAALDNARNSPIARPWQSSSQHKKHTVTSLTVAAERFKDCHLLYLAERALLVLVGLHRSDSDNTTPLAECYSKLATIFSDASAGNMKFAMGTFYRVLYIGGGVPSRLRGKEYIVRNGNYLHVSEFQSLIRSHLQSLVGEGIPVSILPDTAPVPDSDTKEAFAYMTSVNPVELKKSTNTVNHLPPGTVIDSEILSNLARQNEVQTFQFSVPFTKEGKAHAKTIDLQWKRTTMLYVAHPFPYLNTHQEVHHREVRDLTPIEVAIDDITERIATMDDELRKKPSTEQSYINNLMRLVQGTVVPQVNAGAAEVAKVFLDPDNSRALPADREQAEVYRLHLKEALLQFLEKSKLVLEKYRLLTASPLPDVLPPEPTRHSSSEQPHLLLSPSGRASPGANGSSASSPSSKRVIEKYYSSSVEEINKGHTRVGSNGGVSSGGSSPALPDPNGLPPAAPALSHVASANAASELVWLTEMEKGYDLLVDAIYPFVTDVATVSLNRTIIRSFSTFGDNS